MSGAPIHGASLTFRGKYQVAVDGIFTVEEPVLGEVRVGDLLKICGDFQVCRTTAAQENVLGAAAHSARHGEKVSVVVVGLVRLRAGGTVPFGGYIVSGLDALNPGTAIVPVGGGSHLDNVVGRSLEAATVGKRFWALLGTSR